MGLGANGQDRWDGMVLHWARIQACPRVRRDLGSGTILPALVSLRARPRDEDEAPAMAQEGLVLPASTEL